MLMGLRSISHTYQPGTLFARQALQDISLQIEENEFLVITGQEGSGKSTLLLVMAGLIKPDRGQVYYRNQPLPSRGIHPHLGLVFQHPEQQMFELTVGQEVAFGLANRGVRGKQLQSAVARALAAMDLEPEYYQNRRIRELSSGEKRRVAVASILALQPRVLLLDEPLAGLDYNGRCQLLDNLIQLRSQGTTIIMVTHQIDPVYPFCTRMVQLKEGKIAGIIRPQQASPLENVEEFTLPVHVQLLHRLQKIKPALPASTATAEEAGAVIAEHWRTEEASRH